MTRCDYCKKNIDGLPHKCKYCGKTHCQNHLVPENHDCKKVNQFRGNYFNKAHKKVEKEEYENSPYNGSARDLLSEMNEPSKPSVDFDNKPRFSTRLKDFLLSNRLYIIIIIAALSLISPMYLGFFNQNMHFVIGNPRPIYFYDIDYTCTTSQQQAIQSALNYISTDTGVRFIHVPSPAALLSGGIGYGCSGFISSDNSNFETIGESESGNIISTYFILSWNSITLNNFERGVIVHETLHSMGFDHNYNSKSIMYPYYNDVTSIEPEMLKMIKRFYVYNPLAYFNILPFNILMLLVIIFWFTRPSESLNFSIS